MSLRDSYWFLAGALVSVAIMMATGGRVGAPDAAAAGRALQSGNTALPPDHVAAQMPPSQPVQASGSATSAAASAGSLDDVTRKLATRLAANGGTDNDWQLLAESYEYMGRTSDAKAARAHLAAGQPAGTFDHSGQPGPAQVSAEQMAAVADALDTTKGSVK
jgi:cytochrome c-type biogenesis protein CcmH/NrfG